MNDVRGRSFGIVLGLFCVLAGATWPAAGQQSAGVLSQQKISQSVGPFPGELSDGGLFGSAAAALGDPDGNGVPDLAVGASQDGAAGVLPGAVWVLSMEADGDVAAALKIGSGAGGFTGALDNGDLFGGAVAGLGDLDGDGVPDLAVGAAGDDDGAANAGALWVLLQNSDGSVKLQQKTSSVEGGFLGELHLGDGFGASATALGDLDGDGVTELALGATGDDDGGSSAGAFWVLFVQADGRIKDQQKISATQGGFGGSLLAGDRFGSSLAALGDLDGDGVPDLAAGASGDDGGGPNAGAVWILFLQADGSVKAEQELSPATGGFTGLLSGGDAFGASALALPAADGSSSEGAGDKTPALQLAVGAPGSDGGGSSRGAVWLLDLAADGTVLDQHRIDAEQGGFSGVLHDGDGFGSALANPGPAEAGAGAARLLAGAFRDDDGGTDRGAAWLLTLSGDAGAPPYTSFENALVGRPGQPTLILPASTPGDDFIGEPVVAVPLVGGNRVSTQEAQAGTSGGVAFGAPAEFSTGQNPGQADHADFTGDGQDDIVTPNSGGNSVSILPQVSTLPGSPGALGSGGSGGFGTNVDFALPFDAAPVRLRIGDFDGDLLADLVVAGDAGVTVMLGDGAGGLLASDFDPVTNLTDLAVADVNHDDLLDVVAASGGLAQGPGLELGFATVLLGDGDGHLAVAGTFAAGKALAAVLLGNLDPDAHADALVAVHEFDGGPSGEPQGRLLLFLGDGAGGFSPSAVFTGLASPNADGVHPTYGSLADLDNDGALDAVYTSSDNIAFAPGTFGAEQPQLTATVLLNDGAGGFGATELGTPYAGKGVAPLLQDIAPDPLDGNVDCILVWSQDTLAGLTETASEDEAVLTFVAALVGDGTGALIDPAPNHFLAGDEPGSPAVAEVGDVPAADGAPGGLDLLVPLLESNALLALLGDGAGGFPAELTTPDIDQLDPDTLPAGGIWQGGPREAQAGLLDGDGLMDAAVYNQWDDLAGLFSPVASVSLLLGDGAGGFTSSQYLPLARAGELAFGQVGSSPAADVVVSQRIGAGGPDTLLLYGGQEDGSVALPPLVLAIPAGHELAGGLAIADLDDDAQADLVSTARDSATGEGKLLVFANGGGLGAQLHPLASPWPDVRSLDVGDVTGEGIADVVIGGVDGSLFIARGEAGGAFVAAETSAAAAALGGGALRLGSLDGNGFLDLVSSNAAAEGQIDQAFVRLLRGTGEGLFTVQTLAGTSSVGSQGSLRPGIADMNGDGADDLILAHGEAEQVSIVFNTLNTFESYGSGKSGKGGITPQLAGTGFTTLGGEVGLHLTGAVGGAPVLLQVGTGQLDHPFLAVEIVVANLLLVLGGTPGEAGAGGFSLAAHLPAESRFLGLQFTLQVIVSDPDAGPPAPTALAMTPGLAFTIVP